MKYSKSDIQSKTHSLPELKFENQALTSFSGLVIFQKFFAAMHLKQRLQGCFTHLNDGKIYNWTTPWGVIMYSCPEWYSHITVKFL